jgi:uncharacterized protein
MPLANTVDSPTGLWQGTLKVTSTKIRMIFKISVSDNNYFVKFNSPDQSRDWISCSSTKYDKDSLHIICNKINGRYDACFSKNGAKLIGHWSQSGQVFPLILKRVKDIPMPKYLPQEKAILSSPQPYLEEEVSYPNVADSIILAGTLTKPYGDGPFPVVLLITGSGKQGRNEEIFGHEPFLVIADYLTRKGIAVLRVDDRGYGGSTGNFENSTVLDFVKDVKAGIAYLKKRKDINSRLIGLLGHSEGADIAAMTATESQDVAFIVMMAGEGVIGEQTVYLQVSQLRKAEGASESEIMANDIFYHRAIEILKIYPDSASALPELNKLCKSHDSLLHVSDVKYDANNCQNNISVLLSKWFRFYITYDPSITLEKVKVPVLAINGEKDLQVSSKQNLAAIEAALIKGRNKDYSIKELPGLNHLFQTASTGAMSEYGTIKETLAPVALEIISDWIKMHTMK